MANKIFFSFLPFIKFHMKKYKVDLTRPKPNPTCLLSSLNYRENEYKMLAIYFELSTS